MKIGIVGPEEARLGEKETDCTSAVNAILANIRHGRVVKSMAGIRPTDSEVIETPSEVILVSGRCPVSICEHCNRRSYLPSSFPLEFGVYEVCEFCGEKRKRRAGGVDITAESRAKRLGLKTEIYPPEINEWNSRGGKAGFRARNVKVSNASDILFVVTTKSEELCKRCGTRRESHVTSGACWTAIHSENAGKHVIWLIV